MYCLFCNKKFTTKGSKTLHENSCKDNPNRIPGFWENPDYKLKKRNIALSQPKRTEEVKNKISESMKKFYSNNENRELQSLAMKKAVENNPESYSDKNIVGRSEHFTVDGVRYNSTWEYEVTKYLEKENIKWKRSKLKPVPYLWENKWHLYFPDFLLEDLNCYIEVKGYETERDRAKWKYSDKKVILIKQKEIDMIKKGCYDLQMAL